MMTQAPDFIQVLLVLLLSRPPVFPEPPLP